MTTENNLAKICILVEYQIDEEKFSQNGLSQVAKRLHNEFKALDHSHVFDQSSVAKDEDLT